MSLPLLPHPEAWLTALRRIRELQERGATGNSGLYVLTGKFSDQFVYPFLRFTRGRYSYAQKRPPMPVIRIMGDQGPSNEYLEGQGAFTFQRDNTARLSWVKMALAQFDSIIEEPVELGDPDAPKTFGALLTDLDFDSYDYSGRFVYHVSEEYATTEPFYVTWNGVRHHVSPGLAGICLDVTPGDPLDPGLQQYIDIHVMSKVLRRHST